MHSLENASDETAAAKAYDLLRSSLNEYFAKAKDINSERWRMRETALKQAQHISEFEMSEIIGAGEQTSEQHFHVSQPDVVTVQNSPDFYFIRLSFGLLNIRSINLLDVKSKTLHTTSGTHHLGTEDTRILIAQMKLYPAPKITKSVPLKSAEKSKAKSS